MTPKAGLTLTLGILLSAPLAVRAQSIPDAEFAASLSAIAARTAPGLATLKAAPAKPAPAASAVPALLARAQPDFSFTPGHLCSPTDPNFKEYRYAEHIPYCQRNVTQQMKQTVGAHYGIPQSNWSGYEFDHLIPLAIGGDSSIDNLWPQPHDPSTADGSEGKDKLEDNLFHQMSAGTITQADAVRQIYAWFNASQMAAQALRIDSAR